MCDLCRTFLHEVLAEKSVLVRSGQCKNLAQLREISSRAQVPRLVHGAKTGDKILYLGSMLTGRREALWQTEMREKALKQPQCLTVPA